MIYNSEWIADLPIAGWRWADIMRNQCQAAPSPARWLSIIYIRHFCPHIFYRVNYTHGFGSMTKARTLLGWPRHIDTTVRSKAALGWPVQGRVPHRWLWRQVNREMVGCVGRSTFTWSTFQHIQPHPNCNSNPNGKFSEPRCNGRIPMDWCMY